MPKCWRRALSSGVTVIVIVLDNFLKIEGNVVFIIS